MKKLIIAAVMLAGVAVAAWRLGGNAGKPVSTNPLEVGALWAAPDPGLGWMSKEGITAAPETSASMTFWNFGRRATREDSNLSEEGHTQVMILGGGVAQGYGVSDAETFPALLTELFPDYAFENFGTGGYTVDQARTLGERAFGLLYKSPKPQLVILAYQSSGAATAEDVAVTKKSIADLEAFVKSKEALFAAVTVEDKAGNAKQVFEGSNYTHTDCSASVGANTLKDGVHPNAAGQKALSECIAEWMGTAVTPLLAPSE
jgi:hypothetical protein